MMAIGNNEKCPWCDSVMINFKIGGKNSTEHFKEQHEKEFMEALFGKDKKEKEMKTYSVVFHRHYEIPEKDLLEWQDDFDTPEETAEFVARNWLSDEMPKFLNNTEDFMSATIEEKENDIRS